MKVHFFSLFVVFLLFACGEDENNEVSKISIVPEGAIWTKDTIKFEFAPQGFSAMVIWAQAATLKSNQSKIIKASVTIDYWKIIETVKNVKTVIYEDNYDYSISKIFSPNEAGLYCRFPRWFDTSCNDHHDQAYNMFAQNGLLNIDVSQIPDKIVHWWTPRQSSKQNATYSVEARIKVEGSTSVQFGLDYWRDFIVQFNGWDPSCQTSNNCEAWVSDWTGDTQGQFVTITAPRRTQ